MIPLCFKFLRRMKIIQIDHPTGILAGKIQLDGSKSISNRVLMIRALSSGHFKVDGLSTSDDTHVLDELLNGGTREVYDVHHAGTSFRFLTAYLAILPKTKILTGSERMLQRPIAALVEALRQMGANIDYLGQVGYPPLKISAPGMIISEINVKANISSQYLTALILIAPTLEQGLTIHLEGELVSESYLNMTIETVKEFGINVVKTANVLHIPSQSYVQRDYKVEADWSAASYHVSLVALATVAKISMLGLFEKSTQGDAAITQLAPILGVEAQWLDEEWVFSSAIGQAELSYNFVNQPDIAQTVAVICAAKGIRARFTGLQTLSIKETDRISALHNELSKISCGFMESTERGFYEVTGKIQFNGIPQFATYKDHRMAMAFAPLALLHPIRIEEPEVVSKSYPRFWDDLKLLGFRITHV